jgi:peptide/nickel transport system permease protein
MTKRPLIGFAVLIFAIFVLTAAFPEFFAPFDPTKQSLLARLQAPGSPARGGGTYWLGTDGLGRDILSGLIYGARGALFIGVLATLAAAVVGVTLGLFAGYFGGWLSDLILRIADVQLAFPFFLLAITVAAVLGPSFPVILGVLALGNWVVYARVVRSEALDIRERVFIEAAHAIGARTSRIIFLHVLPNCVPSIIVLASFNLAYAILLEAGLSFVGLGLNTDAPSWGVMLANGREYVATAWWLATFPGLCIFLIVLSVNILGDYARDVLDPRSIDNAA